MVVDLYMAFASLGAWAVALILIWLFFGGGNGPTSA